MSIYTKSKTTIENTKLAKNDLIDKNNAIKVSFNPQNSQLILEYLTNLYSNAPRAVVRELFSNACDADPTGFIEINIDKDSDSTYSFSITDHGSGMTKDELEHNYIEYANSSKTNDFNTIGSFGLGSKSPMAISGEYHIESACNNEVYKAIVQRLDTGIYANINKVYSNININSYTKVTVYSISASDIKEMKDFVYYLATYSGRQIVFNNQLLKPSECASLKFNLPTNTNYEITFCTNTEKLSGNLYLNRPVKDYLLELFDDYISNKITIRTTYTSIKTFRTDVYKIIRINNIPYPLNGNYNFINEQNEIKKSQSSYPYSASPSIIIDIEPGYFSFSPSREEIPSGDKKNHIINVLDSPITFFNNNNDKYIHFLSSQTSIDDYNIFVYYIDKFTNERMFNELTKLNNKQINALKKFIDTNHKLNSYFQKLFSNYQIDIFKRNPYHRSFNSKETNASFQSLRSTIFSLIKNQNHCCIRLFTNALKNKNTKLVKRPTKINLTNSAKTCYQNQYMTLIDIFTSNDSIDKEVINFFDNLNNINTINTINHIVIENAVDTPYEIKSKQPQKRTIIPLEDKTINYTIDTRHFFNPRANQENTIQVKDMIKKLPPTKHIIIHDKKLLYGRSRSLDYINWKLNKYLTLIPYKTKTFDKFLHKNNYEVIDSSNYNEYITINKPSDTDYYGPFLVSECIIKNEKDVELWDKYFDCNIIRTFTYTTQSYVPSYKDTIGKHFKYLDYIKDNKQAIINYFNSKEHNTLNVIFKQLIKKPSNDKYLSIQYLHDYARNELIKNIYELVKDWPEIMQYRNMINKVKSFDSYNYALDAAEDNSNNKISAFITKTLKSEMASLKNEYDF